MGVYIKGMEMPPRCGRCDMRISAYDDGMFDHYECCITAAIIDNLGEKMEDCPLVPVPPHGRLIDADALSAKLNMMIAMAFGEGNTAFHFAYRSLGKVVENAPAIIPAEEGK